MPAYTHSQDAAAVTVLAVCYFTGCGLAAHLSEEWEKWYGYGNEQLFAVPRALIANAVSSVIVSVIWSVIGNTTIADCKEKKNISKKMQGSLCQKASQQGVGMAMCNEGWDDGIKTCIHSPITTSWGYMLQLEHVYQGFIQNT